MTMERVPGIQFVTDEAGNRTAVLIGLEEWGELWEDIYDILVSESRRDEPATDWDDLKAELRSEGITFGPLPS